MLLLVVCCVFQPHISAYTVSKLCRRLKSCHNEPFLSLHPAYPPTSDFTTSLFIPSDHKPTISLSHSVTVKYKKSVTSQGRKKESDREEVRQRVS